MARSGEQGLAVVYFAVVGVWGVVSLLFYLFVLLFLRHAGARGAVCGAGHMLHALHLSPSLPASVRPPSLLPRPSFLHSHLVLMLTHSLTHSVRSPTVHPLHHPRLLRPQHLHRALLARLPAQPRLRPHEQILSEPDRVLAAAGVGAFSFYGLAVFFARGFWESAHACAFSAASTRPSRIDGAIRLCFAH